ncbi:MAG: apolipoprotein N-acyltransferase, partial [Armatimonadota bacterium]|nr:apolipoprotein N-acyltransferase [Armatimonadota bacterium]
KLTGIWGLAFLIVLVNVALAEVTHLPASLVVLPKREDEEVRATHFGQNSSPSRFGRGGELVSRGGFPLLTAALVAAALVYGTLTIRAEHLRPTFVAAALQGDIDQNVPQNSAYNARVMQTFLGQCREAARHGARLTVWPETAFPGYLQTDLTTQRQAAAEAVRDHQAQLIGGVEYDWEQHKSANSLFVMNAQGQVTGSYQKRQLVPFGEYVPGVNWLPVLEKLHVTPADMKAGADTQPLLDGGPGIGDIGATICFESSYPRFLREQVARGAGLLVISTDDTWFGRTAEIRQHTAIAAVRAAETDRYLVRSAATGVSQVIDPTGKVLAEAGLFRPAVVWAPVESRATLTPYVRWGDWFVGFCALLLAGIAAAPWLPSRK